MICGLCGGKMKCTKVAYARNHIRRRRQCQSCGTAYTSREQFDGAQVGKGGIVLPEGWTLADCEIHRAWLPTLHADARQAFDEMVRNSYLGDSRGVRLGASGDGLRSELGVTA